MGRLDTESIFEEKDAQVIAICDPNKASDYSSSYYGGVAGRLPVQKQVEEHYAARTPNFKCGAYEDYRVMFEKEKDIDAIICATPDHLHALMSITAMKAGKHVYCEKPLTHNVWEARQVARVARETGVATQMGNFGHSGEGIRMTCEWIWDGAIGPVREVHAWSDNGRGLPILKVPEETFEVPDRLNYDLWLGPRWYRPYCKYYEPRSWRYWWDFGTGVLGDMACHNIDPAVWALDLKAPISVEASAVGHGDQLVSLGGKYHYKFGPRGDQPPVELTWYDGGIHPQRPEDLEEGRRMGEDRNGIIFIGDKGKIMCGGWAGTPRIFPETKMREYTLPPKTLKRVKGHHRDWLDACKGGEQPHGGFEYSARLTELVLLGNVALRAEKKLLWDAENMKATNAPEADSFIKETYREGWELPV
jgi:predicted dehydrogenase